MITAILAFLFLGGLALFSTVHALGVWLVVLITHGLLVQTMGTQAEHLPLIAGLGLAAVIVFRQQWHPIKSSTLSLFLLLGVIMAVSGFLGLDPNESIVSLMRYAKGFMLALLVAGSIETDQDIRLLTLYCLGGLLAGTVAVVYQANVGYFAIETIHVQRAAGLRGDPNDTAMLILAGIPLCAYWFAEGRTVMHRIAFAGVLSILLAGLIYTGSRSGFLSLAFIGAAMLLYRPSWKMVFVLVLAVITLVALAKETYWYRMETLITGTDLYHSQSLEERAFLYRKGLEIFLESPVLGTGPGNFGKALATHAGPAAAVTHSGRPPVAHNMYLEFFVESGVMAGVLLLTIIYHAVRGLMVQQVKSRVGNGVFELYPAVALSLIGMLVANLFLSQGKNSVMWFMIGLGFGAAEVAGKVRRGKICTELRQL